MAFLRIFRTPKPQQYRYIPRFYDPDKEDLENRLRRIQESKEDKVAGVKSRLEGGFMRKGGGYSADSRRIRSGQARRSNARLLVILVALIILSIYFLSVYLPQILEVLE